jgi:hypothetical protein
VKSFDQTCKCAECGHQFTKGRRASSIGRVIKTECPKCWKWSAVRVTPPAGTAAPVRAKPLRESQIEARLKDRALALGGEVRKVRWIGRNGAPDRLVMLPAMGRPTPRGFVFDQHPRTIWVELKAPGRKPTAAQAREHERMRKMGQRVEVVDSYERVEEVLR